MYGLAEMRAAGCDGCWGMCLCMAHGGWQLVALYICNIMIFFSCVVILSFGTWHSYIFIQNRFMHQLNRDGGAHHQQYPWLSICVV